MDELDLFRDFNRGAAAPSEDARRRALASVSGAIHGELPHRTGLLKRARSRRGGIALAFAALAGVLVAALFVETPWKSSTGFLERAQAALTPPPGRILHMKWEHIVTSEDPACTSTALQEVWIDLTPPHTYRAFVPARGAVPETPGIVSPPPDTGGLPCLPNGAPVEVGGALDGTAPVRFVPPNTLAPARRIYFQPTQDPWAWARKLISEGRAHREGAIELDGRTVERVRFDPPTSCPAAPGHCATEPEYGYFDPETLYPVAWDYARDPTLPLVRHRERYLAYEYLSRTTENLALTDIRAQHPDATGP